ncbi:MAG TPA: hypothetical protein VG965_02550 [Patescibacteria group bacterium]|nr:hypothetical protein [Patescibacteria group bacterium]
MERESGVPRDLKLEAYIRSPFRGLLCIIWLKDFLSWAVPAALSAGIALDNKVASVI